MPEAIDLFPDHPAPESGSMLERVALPGIKLTPAQRAFKQWVAKIEEVERRLKEIGGLLDTFRPLYMTKLQALHDEEAMVTREMVLLLDAQLLRKAWTANQRRIMKDMVLLLAEQILDSKYGPEMAVVFNRHSDIPLDALAAEEDARIEASLKELLGVGSDAGDAEPLSQEELMAEAVRLLQEQDAAEAARAEARAAAKRGGRKSAQQLKAEKQALDAGRLMKEIYRKLTSALHPDREPDEAERLRKTALMKEANRAYESGNLLKLLQLQLESGRIDSLAAATMADEKLMQVNHSLREQYQALQHECRQLEQMARDDFGFGPRGVLDAVSLRKALNATVAAGKSNIRIMRQDLADVCRSEASLKAWLKDQHQMVRESEQRDAAMAKAMMSPARRRR